MEKDTDAEGRPQMPVLQMPTFTNAGPGFAADTVLVVGVAVAVDRVMCGSIVVGVLRNSGTGEVKGGY